MEIKAPFSQRHQKLHCLYKNLLSPWYNCLITCCVLIGLYFVMTPLVKWVFCTAQWTVVSDNIRLLLIGQYPLEVTWRPWLCLYLLGGLSGITWGAWLPKQWRLASCLACIPFILACLPFTVDTRLNLICINLINISFFILASRRHRKFQRLSLLLCLLYVPLCILIIAGFSQDGFFMHVGTNLWSGLLLTALLAIIGIGFSFPIGILFALGRRSKLPVIRLFSVIYIEFVRGVPLVTILFMVQIMLPLFLPQEISIDRIIRAMLAIVFFSAAYVAENIRGGLQAIPKGQYEAAYALGLGHYRTMVSIILPQAIRHVIPVLVGLFISLFKDTTLVAIVGLLDILGIAQSIISNPAYLGRQTELYLFVALIFWVFCYSMSYASHRLEKTLNKRKN